MQPQISIVVPIYNVEKYLRQCLDSIVNQTYKDLEIILVDDGSPDSCGAICDEYAAKDERIVVIHKENAGVSVARNDGIERAAGEWIMFVDPDDWLELDCCEQVLRITGKVDCEIIYFQREENNEDGSIAKHFPAIDSRMLSGEDLQKLQLNALADYIQSLGFESTAPWGKLYRRSFLMEYSCKFPVGIKRRQDVIFNLYCLEHLKRGYYYDRVGYHYRRNNNSICRGYNRNMLDILLGFYAKAEEFVIKYHKGDKCRERMLGVLAIKIHGDLRNTLFFNSAGYMPVKEYQIYMMMYYTDPSIKKYLNKPKISDFHSFRDKLSYVLISNRHIYLYYYFCASIMRLKLIVRSIKCRQRTIKR